MAATHTPGVQALIDEVSNTVSNLKRLADYLQAEGYHRCAAQVETGADDLAAALDRAETERSDGSIPPAEAQRSSPIPPLEGLKS